MNKSPVYKATIGNGISSFGLKCSTFFGVWVPGFGKTKKEKEREREGERSSFFLFINIRYKVFVIIGLCSPGNSMSRWDFFFWYFYLNVERSYPVLM